VKYWFKNRMPKDQKIIIEVEKDYKSRAPHKPEKAFKDKSKYNRKKKHKKKSSK